MDNVTLTIRVSRSLREAFEKACAGIDQTASQILRQAMREFCLNHSQGGLFDGTVAQNRKGKRASHNQSVGAKHQGQDD